VGARRAFKRSLALEGGCEAGLGFSDLKQVPMSAHFSTTAIAYQDSAYSSGVSFTLGADATVGRLVTLGMTGRGLWLGSGEEGTEAVSQEEVWGRLGLTHRGHGFQAVVGGGFTQAGDQSTEKIVVGGTAWASWFVTPRVEAAYSSYHDGSSVQAAFAVRAPILEYVSLDGGIQLTQFTAVDELDLPEGSAVPTEDGDWLTSGFASLRVEAPTWQFIAGGRFGLEYRPIRLDEPTLWNLTGRIEASGFVRGAYALPVFTSPSHAQRPIWGYGGYEILRLSSTETVDTSHVHLVTVGISGHFPGVTR